MFLSPFDPGYDFEPPTGSALLAEIGVDRHTVREGFVKLTGLTPKSWKLSKAALSNFNGLASWRNAENSLQSVNLTMPILPPPS